MIDKEIIYNLPKVEVHNHLEGTIDPETFYQLTKKYTDQNFTTLGECETVYDFNDFQGFLSSFSTVTSFLQEPEDLEFIIKTYFSKISDENYRYIEFFVSFDSLLRKGFDLRETLTTLRQSFSRYGKNIITGINIDFVRNYGPKNAESVLTQIGESIDEYRDLIFGISIGGDEIHYPSSAFKTLFEQAKMMGLKTTAHTGEVMNADSIWETILSLRTDRIGHGITAHKSKDLINHLKATQTPLELCLSSNIQTKAISSLKMHPVRKFYEQGVNITINTDDSGFFNTNITKELTLLVDHLNFSIEDLKHLIKATSKSIFLPDLDKKLSLFLSITNELDNIVPEHYYSR